MQIHQIQSVGNNPEFATVGLISVYNTHVYGEYSNYLQKETPDMNCVIISLEGRGEVILPDGHKFPMHEKTVYFGRLALSPTLHSDCEHWHFASYWFVPHNIDLPENCARSIAGMDTQKESDLADKIIGLMQMKLEDKLKFAGALFCTRLFELLDGQDPGLRKNIALVDKIIDYINRHIEERLQIKDIAGAFYYSEKHIRAVFNNTLHISPKQYITKIKLDHVYYFLQHSDASLETLAEKYCFSSSSHLINCFKKEYGVTPSDFRKRT